MRFKRKGREEKAVEKKQWGKSNGEAYHIMMASKKHQKAKRDTQRDGWSILRYS